MQSLCSKMITINEAECSSLINAIRNTTFFPSVVVIVMLTRTDIHVYVPKVFRRETVLAHRLGLGREESASELRAIFLMLCV